MNLLTKWRPLHRAHDIPVFHQPKRWSPLHEMQEMMRGMQRVFATWPSPATTDETMTLAEWTPSVDIGENDHEFVVKAELPEVKKEDIAVNVADGTLSISGERKAEKEEEGLKFHRLERVYGHFERTFTLPAEADPAKITSEFKNGILTVHIPKCPSAKAAEHLIPVD